MAGIIYTLDYVDPSTVTNRQDDVPQIKAHVDLQGRLSSDGVNIFNLALLSIARFLTKLEDASGNIKKIDKLIKNEFDNSSIEIITDNDQLYLIERLFDVDLPYQFRVLNHWTADVRYIRTILVRRLWHYGISKKDLAVLLDHYNLHEYYENVTLGGVDEAEKMTFVMKYNHYLYEFYRRSENYDQEVVECYKERSEVANSCLVYNEDINTCNMRLNLALNKTYDQVSADIDEYCENIKHYVKRVYQINHVEDAYMSLCKGGKGHYRFQFKKWDRCIRVFDLYVGYKAQGKAMTVGRLNRIGKIIVDEFDVYADYEVADRRSRIADDYDEALELIKKSAKGYLA